MAEHSRTAPANRLLPLVLLLALPAVGRAQVPPGYNYTTNNGSITITSYFGPGGAVSIPSMINGLPVTAIGDWAFHLRTSLTSVTIPNSVTNMGRKAFYSCTSLTNVAIPNGLTSVGDDAFALCLRLTSITIPDSVISIGTNAFFNCSGLANVTIGNGVTSIGDNAFGFCSGLTSITIPDMVTNLGDYALFDCTSLTSVTIGKSVTSISDQFSGCTSLIGFYFQGNAPENGFDFPWLPGAAGATVYYLPGTVGWGPSFRHLPTVLWNPQVQTRDASFGVLTNRFGFTITGTSNLAIGVEACTNLANPTWSPVGTNTLTGGSSYFSDPQWTNYPARFYRLTQPQTGIAAPPNGATRLADGSMQVVFSGAPGHLYAVQASSNLTAWTILAIVPANSSNKIIYLDNTAPSPSTRYYRLEPGSDAQLLSNCRDVDLPEATRVLAGQAFACFFFNQPGPLLPSPLVDEAIAIAYDLDPTNPTTLILRAWHIQLYNQVFGP